MFLDNCVCRQILWQQKVWNQILKENMTLDRVKKIIVFNSYFFNSKNFLTFVEFSKKVTNF